MEDRHGTFQSKLRTRQKKKSNSTKTSSLATKTVDYVSWCCLQSFFSYCMVLPLPSFVGDFDGKWR